MNNPWIRKISLSVASSVFLLLAIEGAYRLNLYWKWRWAPPEPWMYSYFVGSAPIDYFHPQFGYELPPHQEVFFVFVKQGYPFFGWPLRINSLGNMDREKNHQIREEIRILVFGDSFAAFQLEGNTWPDVLQDRLAAATRRQVGVYNFGRGGYGLLHMVDLAAAKVPEFKPDLVLFTFITDDLTRARSWRTVNQVHGMTRVFTSLQPEDQADLSKSVDTYLVNSRVNREWYDAMTQENKPDDPLLLEINNQCRLIKRQNARYIPFLSFRHSFVFKRLAIHNPMHGLPKPTDLPRMSLASYREDARFVENVDILRRFNVPCLLLHLPERHEMTGRRYVLNEQHRSLIASLEELFGTATVPLLADMQLPPPGRMNELFWPVDGHPSRSGLENYAQAAARALLERDLFKIPAESPR